MWWLCCLAALAPLVCADTSYTVPCVPGDTFECDDGSCITLHNRCDGSTHCPDRSDELYCVGITSSDTPVVKSCQESEFQCKDGSRCIPANWRCNMEMDCDDASDELNCSRGDEKKCAGWLCGNGRCISSFWRCDGEADCPDRSDELNCSQSERHKALETPAAHIQALCNKDNGFFPCTDNSFCLRPESVCNGHQDCRDGSDEGSGCMPHTCMDKPCENGCLLTPSGPYCRCPHRYIRATNGTCVDVDECQDVPGSCSQKCKNIPGGHVCSCAPQYILQNDAYSCRVNDTEEPIMVFTSSDAVKAMYLRSRRVVTIAKNVRRAVGVATDGTLVYWSEVDDGHEAIVRAEVSDPRSTREVVVSSGLDTPESIALDWATGALYFVDSARQHIVACSPDGRICAAILTRNLQKPRGLVLHVSAGVMYWTDWGAAAHIGRANMDGSEARVFVSDDLVWPNGLTLDLPAERLYWVDGGGSARGGIATIRLDGTGRHRVLAESVHHPYWLSVFEGRLFWSDWGSNTVQACDKWTGKERHELIRGRVHGIHIYHPAVEERDDRHPCASAPCSDLCLLRGATYACMCSAERELAPDQHTCRDAVRPTYALVTGGRVAVHARLQSLGRLDAAPTLLRVGSIDAVTYDDVNDMVYLYDGQRRSIDRVVLSNLESGETSSVVDFELEQVVDLAYDDVAGVLYWADARRRTLEAWSPKSESRAILYRFADDETPLSFAAVPSLGMLAVAVMDERGQVHVDSWGMDGGERKHLFEHGFKGPMVRVRWVPDQDRLFIADSGNGLIESAHPHGTGRETFRSPSTTVWSLCGVGDELLWTDRRTPTLYWSSLHETDGATVRRLSIDVFGAHAQLLVTTVGPRTSPAPEPHACASAPCSHLCVQRAVGAFGPRYACLCPANMFPHGNGSCAERERCGWDEMLCARSNTCVSKQRRCDRRADCPDGEDEEDCKGTDGCGSGRWACDSGQCVSEHQRCDGWPDCNDDSDESGCEHKPAVCEAEMFDCGSGVCIDRRQVCDAREDCADGSDETDCAAPMCTHGFFQCERGNCVPGGWECDGELDCEDGSDEHGACPPPPATDCAADEWRCADGGCVSLARRCDAALDCADGSDERDCAETTVTVCDELEFECASNRTVCVALSAMCDGRKDCPKGEDEVGCGSGECGASEAECADGEGCVSDNFVCDGVEDCRDGSDESPEACRRRNATLTTNMEASCSDGFACVSGHCLEYTSVCDNHTDCPDGSDEHGACDTACLHHQCEGRCVATPRGARCACGRGYTLAADGRACADRDECAAAGERRACAHHCTNTRGSFVCTCRPGYALRSDRRSCKAVGAPLQLVYAADSAVLAAPASRPASPRTLYTAEQPVSDVAVNLATGTLYCVSAEGGALHSVPLEGGAASVVRNVGRPARLAVDWRSDVVYLADASRGRLRACSVSAKACAELDPEDNVVTALAADPTRGLLVYCAGDLYRRSADGRQRERLAEQHSCSALAVDAGAGHAYVAHDDGAVVVPLDGSGSRKVELHGVSAPRSLGVFEDTLFALGDAGQVLRCTLFADRRCTIDRLRTPRVRALALKHQALQMFAESVCARATCAAGTVCVASGAHEHSCLCPDGKALDGDACSEQPSETLAVFDESGGTASGGRGTLAVLMTLAVLAALALGVFLYVRLSRRRPAFTQTVYFRGNGAQELTRCGDEPAVDITPPRSERCGYTEFVNPVLDRWRAVWKPRQIKPEQEVDHLSVPLADSDSEVESDRDNQHDKTRLI